jgi:flagellar basal-body rod protein FlgB
MTDLSQIPLFSLADRRLAWLGRRQEVLAENVANADTPGWRARDLPPFARLLRGAGVTLARTEPGHLSGSAEGGIAAPVAVPGEQAPDGNGVALDRELVKIADTDTAHAFVLGVMQSYLGMFRMALGK